jgi:hypothetical protein
MGTKSSIGGCHGGHAVAPRTQAPFAKIRAKPKKFPPSPCCGTIGATPPLKTVLKPSRKPPGKSVNLQDAQPHGLHPGAPGPQRQVLGAAFEPQMSIWDPVVLGGCLGCSIWSVVYKQQKTPTAYNGGRLITAWTPSYYLLPLRPLRPPANCKTGKKNASSRVKATDFAFLIRCLVF